MSPSQFLELLLTNNDIISLDVRKFNELADEYENVQFGFKDLIEFCDFSPCLVYTNYKIHIIKSIELLKELHDYNISIYGKN